jgi:long-chain acyl-CoA synthetase
MPVSAPLEQFLKWEKKIPGKIFLRQPFDGRWKTWTWAEAGIECRKLAASMRSMGLPDGSHVAILSKNCAHWIMADIAIMMAGYVSVPVYPSLSAASIQPILEHSDTKIIIVGKLDDYPRQKAGIPKDVNVISVEAYGIKEDVTWEKSVSYMNPVKSVYEWKPTDILTIIYTSGNNRKSKGA